MTSRKRNQQWRIRVRGVRRKQPDFRKLGRALILFAEAQAEKEAMTDHQRRQAKRKRG